MFARCRRTRGSTVGDMGISGKCRQYNLFIGLNIPAKLECNSVCKRMYVNFFSQISTFGSLSPILYVK